MNEVSISRKKGELPIVIVGAGVSGLTAAFRLTQAGRKVIVCESTGRPGGNIQTTRHDGFTYDLGPDSFLRTKPQAEQLCRDLGLAEELITPLPGASLVFVAHEGGLVPMPEGLSLGVPKRPGPLLDTPLLSGVGKLRALLEPFIKPLKSDDDESIAAFTTRRLGPEMATRLAAPLLSGVFAGDADRLSMKASFPQLLAAERKFGSLFSGMNGGKSIWEVLTADVVTPASPFLSLRSGLGSLIDTLCAKLPQNCLRLSTEVSRLVPGPGAGSPVEVHLKQETISASHVIFAGPPWAAARLLGKTSSALAHPLKKIRGFPTATVFFGLKEVEVQGSLRGSGFIVPPGEAEILAGTFISSKWEARAPKGAALVRAFVGGTRLDIEGKGEKELTSLAHRELTRLLGPLGTVTFSRVHLYDRGTPQPEMGHLELLHELHEALENYPWLSVIGSGYGGVGIPDCVRQADESVRALLAL